MKNILDHTLPLFSRERVIAGPTQFYAMSRFNLKSGPIRDTLAEAEADCDRLYEYCENIPQHMIGWCSP
jgi:hypothetical protein